MQDGKIEITIKENQSIIEVTYKRKGKSAGRLTVPNGNKITAQHNNTDCQFERYETGALLFVKLGDGTILYQAKNALATKTPIPPNYPLADIYGLNHLPANTRDILKNNGEIENFALKLNKAAFCDFDDKNKFKFFLNPRTGNKQMIKPNFSKVGFAEIAMRQNHYVTALFGENAKKIEAKPDWRWLTGNGVESVYETNITLHHVYGIPYLPSSSLKGILRSVMITELWGMEHDSEARAFHESKLMCDLFGCPKEIEFFLNKNKKKCKTYYYKKYDDKQQITSENCPEKQGALCFFDFYPQSEPQIEVDVMTPHYGKYYKNPPEAPADTDSPNPIPFLCVGNNAYFQTYLAISEKFAAKKLIDYIEKDKVTIDKLLSQLAEQDITIESTLLEMATAFLESALSTHGIGAKTAVGYGYFQ